MSLKIFISHAATDEKLASALVDCIFSCMVLDDNEVRCTSVPGHKLTIGSEIATILRDDLEETSVVIGLLSKNAILSSWVLFELGATWGAQKKIKPLLTDDLDYKDLPGPLSGRHAARLSNKNDLTQFFDELCHTINSKPRTASKIESAINRLVKINSEYSENSFNSKTKKIIRTKLEINEPTISGMKYKELIKILAKEKITLPQKISGENRDIETDLLSLFLNYLEIFNNGIQSNHDSNSLSCFLYNKVGLKLIAYELVKFDKLPAAQAKYFKRINLSPNGQKFITYYNYIQNQKKK